MAAVLSAFLLAMQAAPPAAEGATPPPSPVASADAGLPAAVLPFTGVEADRFRCVEDRSLCLALDVGNDPVDVPAPVWLHITVIGTDTMPTVTTRMELDGADDARIWPYAVRLDSRDPWDENDGWVIGVVRLSHQNYSGGSATGARLSLYRLVPQAGSYALGDELASLPWTGSISIRACFGEEDARRRRGVCHDEYDFTAALDFAADEGGPYPLLRFRTLATAYPASSRRTEDNSGATTLTEADLVRWRDPLCSYDRLLRYNPAARRYEMEAIAPECSDYTQP